jgi:isocitrate lyase
VGKRRPSAGTRFRHLLERERGLFAYGIYDAMSAHVAEMAGAECLYIGGYAAAARDLWPDMGIMSSTEVLDHVRRIDRVAQVPLIADIDDGYGGILNVIRTAQEFLSLPNVAGIHIEDQRYPKRCGHIAGKEVIPLDDFVGKLKAVVDVRNEIDPQKVVIARTDAFSASGGKKDPHIGGDIEEAIKRGLAYAEAGADLVWCEFPSPDDLSALAFADGLRRVRHDFPLAFNVSPSFKPGTWEVSRISSVWLNQIGYKFRFATYPAIMAAMAAVFVSAEEFQRDEVSGLRILRARVKGLPTESVMKVVGVDSFQELEERYDPKAKDRIEQSEGFKRET